MKVRIQLQLVFLSVNRVGAMILGRKRCESFYYMMSADKILAQLHCNIQSPPNIYLLARHMQFPAKVQKSYAVYKMIIPARVVQKCFETSILFIGKAAGESCTRIEVSKHFWTSLAGLIILYTAQDFFTFAGNCM